MSEREQQILDFLLQPSYRPLDRAAVIRRLKLDAAEHEEFHAALDGLIDSKRVRENRKGLLRPRISGGTIAGIVRRTRAGDGYFVAHETQLEASANAALTRYREANKKSRTKAAPKHFNRAYKVQRLAVSQAEKELWEMPELDDHITRAQSDLENVVKALSERYDEALKSYRELDVLVPGT